jgi:hypothetical protein
MAYITIPQLTAGTALTGLEQFEAVQSSASVKLTANQLKTFVNLNPQFIITDSSINTVAVAANFIHDTTANPATITAGMGVSVNLSAELNVNGVFNGASIASVAENVTSGSEAMNLQLKTSLAGAAPTTKVLIASNGRVTITPEVTLVDNLYIDAINTNSSIAFPITLNHKTTDNTAATGIGTGILFQCNLSGAGSTSGVGVGQLNMIATDVSSVSTSKFDFVIRLLRNVTLSEVARFTSDKKLGVGTNTPATALEVALDDANNSSAVSVSRFTHTTSSSAAVGIGTAVEFATETNDGIKVGAAIFTQSTDLTVGSEDFVLSIGTMTNGASPTEKFRVGEVIYTPRFIGAGVIPTNAWLTAGAGTSSIAASKFTAGSLLSSPITGGFEYDGYAAYFTPQSTNRGVLPAEQFFQLGADLSGNGATTAAQTMFGRVVSLASNTRYAYEICALITCTAGGGKTIGYALGGTAVLSAHSYTVISSEVGTSTTVSHAHIMRNRVLSSFATPVVMSPSGAAGSTSLRICGTIDMLSGSSGTVDFQFNYSTNGTVVTIGAGSYVKIYPVQTINATTDNTQIGTWS